MKMNTSKLFLPRLLLLLIMLALCSEKKSKADEQATRPEHRKLSANEVTIFLRQADGLHLAAKASGGVFVLNSPGDDQWGYPNLALLAKGSDLIVDGVVTSKVSRLSEDRRFMYTDVTVTPLLLLKGSVAGPISFTVPGGKIQFPDGTTAEVDTIGFLKLMEGKEIIALLSKGSDSRFRPSKGISALISCSSADNGAVRSLAPENSAHVIPGEVNGMPTSKLISRLKELVMSDVQAQKQ